MPKWSAQKVFWMGIWILPQGWPLAAGDGADDEKRLDARSDRCRQRGIRWLMGQIPCTGEKPQKWAAFLRYLVANRAAQHWIAGFEGVQDRTLSRMTLNLEFDVAANMRQRLQMRRQYHFDRRAHHGSVWTSTESTAGRSRTMGAQLSPAFADA